MLLSFRVYVRGLVCVCVCVFQAFPTVDDRSEEELREAQRAVQIAAAADRQEASEPLSTFTV